MQHQARVLYVMDDDFSEFETLKQVLDLAREYPLDLTLFDIAQSVAGPSRLMITSLPLNNLRDRTLRNRQARLEAFISMINSRSCKLRARTSFGIRAKEIISEAAKGDYDLVIKRREKGSTDKRVSRDCQCPVWVIGPEDYTESGQIAVSILPRVASRNDHRTARICAQEFYKPDGCPETGQPTPVL